jgi:hypothetical protein
MSSSVVAGNPSETSSPEPKGEQSAAPFSGVLGAEDLLMDADARVAQPVGQPSEALIALEYATDTRQAPTPTVAPVDTTAALASGGVTLYEHDFRGGSVLLAGNALYRADQGQFGDVGDNAVSSLSSLTRKV